MSINQIIAPEISNDEFYDIIKKLAAENQCANILEIGSSSGGGSTQAFVDGLMLNNKPGNLFCIEISRPRFEVLKSTYEHLDFVKCYNGSTVSSKEFPDIREIVNFYDNTASSLNSYPLTQILSWLEQYIEYIKNEKVPTDIIERIKYDYKIDYFDIVLIDGSEFSGNIEYEKIKGARIILLDDTNSFKCFEARRKLLLDPMYELLADNQYLRNGYSVFKKRSSPKSNVITAYSNELPVHFFTIDTPSSIGKRVSRILPW